MGLTIHICMSSSGSSATQSYPLDDEDDVGVDVEALPRGTHLKDPLHQLTFLT